MAIVNNFRRIHLSDDKKPEHLVEFFTYEEFIVYSSNFNQLLYTVYNPNDEIYYFFENQESDDIENDLIQNIKTYFKK